PSSRSRGAKGRSARYSAKFPRAKRTANQTTARVAGAVAITVSATATPSDDRPTRSENVKAGERHFRIAIAVAICAADIARKMATPQSRLPQNFQTRGGAIATSLIGGHGWISAGVPRLRPPAGPGTARPGADHACIA